MFHMAKGKIVTFLFFCLFINSNTYAYVCFHIYKLPRVHICVHKYTLIIFILLLLYTAFQWMFTYLYKLGVFSNNLILHMLWWWGWLIKLNYWSQYMFNLLIYVHTYYNYKRPNLETQLLELSPISIANS